MSSKCKYCTAPIIWARNEKSGNPMPFDVEPQNWGWVHARRGDQMLAIWTPFYRPHFSSCEKYPKRGGSSDG